MLLSLDVRYRDGRYTVSCTTCKARHAFDAKTFDEARAVVIALGWQERPRKGGPKKAHWACLTCAKPPEQKSMGPSSSRFMPP